MTHIGLPQPHDLSARHEIQSLIHERLVVQVGGNYIGADLCQDAPSRARIVSLGHPSKIAVGTCALWIHTGEVRGTAAEQLSVVVPNTPSTERRQYLESDLVTYGNLRVTTPERTVIDLLLDDIEKGIECALILFAQGVDPRAVARRAHTLTHLHGLRDVRTLLDQLATTRSIS